MTTLYTVALIVGGVFVLLSVLGGFGDADADIDVDTDADIDVDVDADADIDVDADAELDGDGIGGDVEAIPQKKFRPWLSFKFYTFSLAFFGLTGLVMTQLAGLGELWSAGIATVMGLVAGLFVTYLMYYVDRSSMKTRAAGQRAFLGAQAQVLLPVEEGKTGRVRVRLDNRTVDMRAEPAEEDVVLGTDEECYVLDVDEGVVRVVGADALRNQE